MRQYVRVVSDAYLDPYIDLSFIQVKPKAAYRRTFQIMKAGLKYLIKLAEVDRGIPLKFLIPIQTLCNDLAKIV